MVRIRTVARAIACAGVMILAAQTSAQAAVTWSQETTPNPAGSDANSLASTDVVSAGEAWSVGLTHAAGAAQVRPLIEHWTTARGWQVAAGATIPAGVAAQLSDVASTGAADAWSVGRIADSSGRLHGLIERWNGTAWQRVAAPAAEPAASALQAVSARTASDAWAVGTTTSSSTGRPTGLIERWNGSTWSIVTSVQTAGGVRLIDVAAVSASDVWAVGRTGELPFLEHWNGVAWSAVTLPPIAGEGGLRGLTAVAANDVWAVGFRGTSTLTLHWNGTAWTVVPSPDAADGNTTFVAAAALGRDDVWAVGLSIVLGSLESTVTEHWDGTAWTLVPSPNAAGVPRTVLLGVDGRVGGPLFAVGGAESSDGTSSSFTIRG